MLTFQFTGVSGEMLQEELLTSGMVGQMVKLQFDDFWEEYYKTVVFVAGGICRTAEVPADEIHMTGIEVAIPPEVLIGGQRLFVGVYGHMDDGANVNPTVMVKGPRICHGADPTESPDGGNLPVWKNLQEQIGQLEELDTQAKDSLVAAINEILAMTPEAGAAGEDGATFTPHVSEYGVLTWTNDKGLANPAAVNITGPDGEKGEKGDTGATGAVGPAGAAGADGADGKSAYQYAQEGGYEGSETEFAAKLAEDLPSALPNPQKLTFTGAVSASYDGSEAVSVTIPSGGSSGGGTAAWTLQELTTTEDLTVVDLPIGDGCEEVYLIISLASGVRLSVSWIGNGTNSYRDYGFSFSSVQGTYRLNFRSLLAYSSELLPFLVGTTGGNTAIPMPNGPYWTDKTNCIAVKPYTSGEVIPTGSKFTWVYR